MRLPALPTSSQHNQHSRAPMSRFCLGILCPSTLTNTGAVGVASRPSIPISRTQQNIYRQSPQLKRSQSIVRPVQAILSHNIGTVLHEQIDEIIICLFKFQSILVTVITRCAGANIGCATVICVILFVLAHLILIECSHQVWRRESTRFLLFKIPELFRIYMDILYPVTPLNIRRKADLLPPYPDSRTEHNIYSYSPIQEEGQPIL